MSIALRVALPHPSSLNYSTEGGPRAEFMFETVHAVSMVDLVIADWTRVLRKELCLYLQRDIGIMSVETSSESLDGC